MGNKKPKFRERKSLGNPNFRKPKSLKNVSVSSKNEVFTKKLRTSRDTLLKIRFQAQSPKLHVDHAKDLNAESKGGFNATHDDTEAIEHIESEEYASEVVEGYEMDNEDSDTDDEREMGSDREGDMENDEGEMENQGDDEDYEDYEFLEDDEYGEDGSLLDEDEDEVSITEIHSFTQSSLFSYYLQQYLSGDSNDEAEEVK